MLIFLLIIATKKIFESFLPFFFFLRANIFFFLYIYIFFTKLDVVPTPKEGDEKKKKEYNICLRNLYVDIGFDVIL